MESTEAGSGNTQPALPKRTHANSRLKRLGICAAVALALSLRNVRASLNRVRSGLSRCSGPAVVVIKVRGEGCVTVHDCSPSRPPKPTCTCGTSHVYGMIAVCGAGCRLRAGMRQMPRGLPGHAHAIPGCRALPLPGHRQLDTAHHINHDCVQLV